MNIFAQYCILAIWQLTHQKSGRLSKRFNPPRGLNRKVVVKQANSHCDVWFEEFPKSGWSLPNSDVGLSHISTFVIGLPWCKKKTYTMVILCVSCSCTVRNGNRPDFGRMPYCRNRNRHVDNNGNRTWCGSGVHHFKPTTLLIRLLKQRNALLVARTISPINPSCRLSFSYTMLVLRVLLQNNKSFWTVSHVEFATN